MSPTPCTTGLTPTPTRSKVWSRSTFVTSDLTSCSCDIVTKEISVRILFDRLYLMLSRTSPVDRLYSICDGFISDKIFFITKTKHFIRIVHEVWTIDCYRLVVCKYLKYGIAPECNRNATLKDSQKRDHTWLYCMSKIFYFNKILIFKFFPMIFIVVRQKKLNLPLSIEAPWSNIEAELVCTQY